MAKKNRINELYEWLENNKIKYSKIDEYVVEIPSFGKAYFQDTQKSTFNSIFRKDKEENLIFNSMEDPDILLSENIEYIVFKFGNNFYYYDLKKDFEMNILKFIGERVEPKCKTKFVNLGVHTPFELLNGSFMPDKWVKKAKLLGHTHIGICDKNTMAACFTLQKECDLVDMLPVFGYTLTIEAGGIYDNDGEELRAPDKFEAKVYVQSNQGYKHLLRIQKAIMVDNVENKTIQLSELCEHGEGNVIVLGKHTPSLMLEHPEYVEQLKNAFDGIYYQVDLTEYKAERIDIKVLESAKFYFDNLYKQEWAPRPVLIGDCYYLDKDNAKNKIILNKVAEGAAHEQSDEQYFKDVDEHFEVFQNTFGDNWDVQAIFDECCANTIKIAEGATADLRVTRNYMPQYDLTEEEKAKYGTSYNMFHQLLEEGLQRLAPKDKIEQYRKQMEYEKYIIESTNNVDYLLVQYDTCNWARKNGILVGCGRGSAAGSLLLYLLGITLIDPIKYDLIFERFLLPERAGLYPSETTIIGDKKESTEYMEIELENGTIVKLSNDSKLIVKREGQDEPVHISATELQDGDDILFDNKDELFTINNL